MSQSCFSLGFLSQIFLWKLSTFCGYKGIYSRVYEECERLVFIKQDILATRPRDWNKSRANFLARLKVYSCSTLAGVTFQLPLHASHVCHSGDLPVVRLASREIQSWDSIELHTSWDFFTLSHTLPLHNSYLNIGYLIAKLQANLARNKANTWLNKFNLTYLSTLIKNLFFIPTHFLLHNMDYNKRYTRLKNQLIKL